MTKVTGDQALQKELGFVEGLFDYSTRYNKHMCIRRRHKAGKESSKDLEVTMSSTLTELAMVPVPTKAIWKLQFSGEVGTQKTLCVNSGE